MTFYLGLTRNLSLDITCLSVRCLNVKEQTVINGRRVQPKRSISIYTEQKDNLYTHKKKAKPKHKIKTQRLNAHARRPKYEKIKVKRINNTRLTNKHTDSRNHLRSYKATDNLG